MRRSVQCVVLLLCSEKQAELQLIQDKLMAQKQQKTSNEDARIQAAIAEREALKAGEEAEKEAKRAKMLDSIKEHRAEQVQTCSGRPGRAPKLQGAATWRIFKVS